MSENNKKRPESDAENKVDLIWELQKNDNRMLDVLGLIKENATKIRSNSARISRVQAEMKRARESGEWEESEEGEGLFQMEPKLDPFDISPEELARRLGGEVTNKS